MVFSTKYLFICRYKQRVKALNVKNVGKIVSSRIFAVTVHPAEEKTVAFISGKHGDIGVWDVVSNRQK